MSSSGKIALISGIVFVLFTVFVVIGLFSIKFTAGIKDNAVVSSNDNLKNVHSSVNKILQTSGITVKNYGETKIKAIEAQIKAYADKPQMMMMWVKENPQQIDNTLWLNFQSQVEKYYTKFEVEQKHKISLVQEYRDYLDNSWAGIIATNVWNYPKPNTLKIMNQVIATEETTTTFETGVDKAVQPF